MSLVSISAEKVVVAAPDGLSSNGVKECHVCAANTAAPGAEQVCGATRALLSTAIIAERFPNALFCYWAVVE